MLHATVERAVHLCEDGYVVVDDRVDELISHFLHEVGTTVQCSVFACCHDQQDSLLATLFDRWVPVH